MIRTAFTPSDILKIECGYDICDRRHIFSERPPYIQITFPVTHLETFKKCLELTEDIKCIAIPLSSRMLLTKHTAVEF